jgi:hypothetical protein
MPTSESTPKARRRPAGFPQALEAAERLHAFLLRRYWDGSGLVGPDMGIRLNYRVGRFVKSALRALPWKDDLYYLQAQAYWESANWSLYEATGERRYRDLALACAERMLAGQREDGGWDYPNPEWRSRTATTEGTWGAIGLLEAYRVTGDARFLLGARRWWHYLERETGFQAVLGGEAVNYFAGRVGAVVPNCSSLVLHFLAELVASGEPDAGERCAAIVTFLRAAQRPNGELPYSVTSPAREARLVHYQCFQYNAFEHLDLVRYHRLSGDGRVLPVVAGVLRF